jgi:hypothetical protein
MKSANNTIRITGTCEPISAEVIFSNRKTLALQVHPDGRVVIRAPRQTSKREIIKFFKEHEEWIRQNQRKLRARAKEKETARAQYDIPPYDSLSDMEKCRIRVHFLERLRFYAAQMGVTYNRVTIRNQKGRWGSCSAKGNLNFNYRLHYLPDELLDYVVVHELAHRIHMNHSAFFWAVIEKYMPDYQARRELLKEIGIG